MRLGLSSAAAPDAPLADLLEACARRGIAALELREGDAHGVRPGDPAGAAAAAAEAGAAGVAISGYRLDPSPQTAHAEAALAELAAALGAPLIVGEAVRLDGAVGVAWDADPLAGDVAAQGAALLERVGGRLHTIRLVGGGPETALNEGRGIGALMTQLALAGWAGTLVLAPSGRGYRVAWEQWLGRRGGTGCGSKVADPSLVQVVRRPARGVAG